MKIENNLYSYDEMNVNYSLNRNEDPYIAKIIRETLGDYLFN